MSNSVKEQSVSQYVGNFLKKELQRRGKTQEAFAEEVGVADRTVRRWVSGEIHSLEGVQEIAWALNISIRDIFSEWDDVPSPSRHVCISQSNDTPLGRNTHYAA